MKNLFVCCTVFSSFRKQICCISTINVKIQNDGEEGGSFLFLKELEGSDRKINTWQKFHDNNLNEYGYLTMSYSLYTEK